MVKANLEPVVDIFMNLVVFVAELLRSYFLFQRLGFRSSAILVRPANIERLPPASLVISKGKVWSAERKRRTAGTHLAKTSALRTEPTMLPRWGTLLTYGRALVMRIFLSPFLGRILGSEAILGEFGSGGAPEGQKKLFRGQ